jgi:hypothetical protein
MEAAMRRLRGAAWIAAYLVLLLLAAIWAADGLVALREPLLDIGRPHVGDGIVTVARLLVLSPESALALAHGLAGAKLFIAIFLLMTVIAATLDWATLGATDNAMLDVGVFFSAIASVIAAAPIATQAGVPLQSALGELLLAAIASGLAMYGRGMVVERAESRVETLEAGH